MNKIAVSIAFILMSIISAAGQETVKGKIVDKDGMPIPGARVSVKGGEESVLSEFDGSFTVSLDGNRPSGKLIVDYIGYNSKTVAVDNASEIVLKKTTFWDHVLVMPSFGICPEEQQSWMSYGLMLGYVDRFGGYLKFRSDFKRITSTNLRERRSLTECNSNGETADGYIWTTGNYEKNRMQATGGVIMRFCSWLYGYAGAGYGYADVWWEDYFGEWMRVTDLSAKGIAAEGGLIFKVGPVSLSAGVSTTAFKYSELEVGIGIML